MFAFFSAHHRRKYLHLRTLRPAHHRVDDLVDRLFGDFASAVRTMRVSDACKEEPIIIVDFGDRADRRTRVFIRRFLFDRNRRRKPFDQIDVGFVHRTQKLARVRREAFHITPLPFGKERVERERRFSRTGKTGKHDEFIARQIDVDVLQIVLARTSDTYFFARDGRDIFRIFFQLIRCG